MDLLQKLMAKIADTAVMLFSVRIMIVTGLMVTAFSLQAANGGPSSIDFTSESFERAKARATQEGKLYFVDFYANWCTPCKWMEKTTFQDKEVVDLLNNNYVSIKVDIDTKEGFAIKEKYQISVLPTLLIFNSEGELVERVQETLSRSKLMNLLNFHVQGDSKVVTNHYFNQSPNEHKPIDKPATDPAIQEKYKEYRDSKVKKNNYRVQLGDFDNYEAALNKVNEMRDQFLEEIVVLNDYRDGKVWYKVLMGKFATENEADSFAIILKKDYDINSIVF